MVKPIISYMNKAYKISWGRRLEVVPFAQNFGQDDIRAVIKCIFDCRRSANKINYQGAKTSFFQCLPLFIDNKIYIFQNMYAVIHEQETNTDSCKSNDQFKSLTGIVGGQALYLRYILATWQHICETIKISMKLYSSILDKCRYTSLELAVQAAARMAYPIANFRTSNPVKVGSSDNNE
ncbi:hypothetical protein A6770_26755 [Nostoc minutum NIES-26]|uniref:Uncharacterized protein n=1 Tax=Nostoc minutum NIES-26 TaxID=1844469 RepID=A0A367QPK7_9NOSO|nr:hypothetical protein A6770_26755 [Nostoc minutum NIES-26]